MPVSDRRGDPRFMLIIPVRFHHPSAGEIATQAVNVSRSGLFLKSPQKLAVGSSLHLNLRVPTEISGSVFSELRCTGRVVHERQAEGSIGYGIEIVRLTSGFRAVSNAQASAFRV